MMLTKTIASAVRIITNKHFRLTVFVATSVLLILFSAYRIGRYARAIQDHDGLMALNGKLERVDIPHRKPTDGFHYAGVHFQLPDIVSQYAVTREDLSSSVILRSPEYLVIVKRFEDMPAEQLDELLAIAATRRKSILTLLTMSESRFVRECHMVDNKISDPRHQHGCEHVVSSAIQAMVLREMNGYGTHAVIWTTCGDLLCSITVYSVTHAADTHDVLLDILSTVATSE